MISIVNKILAEAVSGACMCVWGDYMHVWCVVCSSMYVGSV